MYIDLYRWALSKSLEKDRIYNTSNQLLVQLEVEGI